VTPGRRGRGEGSIYRRKDALWVGSLDLGQVDGKRQRRLVYGQSQAAVRDKLRALQRVVESGAMPAPANLTVGRFLETWLREFLPGTVSPRTEDIYANIVLTYLVPTVGSTKLGKLSPADVSRMLASLERRGYAPETRRKARAVLRRALRRAEQEGMVSRNVAAIADGPKVPRREAAP
jgi:integrase